MLSFFRKKKKASDPQAVLSAALSDFELPAFSASIMQTLQLLRDPATDSRRIARSIEVNPGLLIRVLRTVNSAAYGMTRKIDNVAQAVTLMGRSVLESLVIVMAVRKQLPTSTDDNFHGKRFWIAATRRAAVARSLAGLLHPQTQSEAFVSGLLQDMAVPLLVSVGPSSYAPLYDHWHGDAAAQLEQLERGEYGWCHAVVGSAMAQKWELPVALTKNIDAHHEDDDGADPAVRLAAKIREHSVTPGVEQLVETCRADYGLKPDRVVSSVKSAFTEADDLAKLFV